MKKVVCFNKPEEPNGYLSNWYRSDFTADGRRFSSMEQYMMFRKATLFGDLETVEQIMATDNVGRIKALGRSVTPYEETFWNGMRQIAVFQGLLAKFEQNAELREKLLATGEHILAECAVQDRIWGIGLSMKDDRRHDPAQWQGQNLLGFALMTVRESLRRGGETS